MKTLKIFTLFLLIFCSYLISTNASVASWPPHPTQAVQIVRPIENNNASSGLALNTEALAKILLDPKVADKPVMPIVIAGPFRKGKSFLMNFLLRYLQHRREHPADFDWLDPSVPLHAGFGWRGGSRAHTRGIWVWPESFLLRDAKGLEVAVLLGDSEGNFAPNMGTIQNTDIFTLCMFFASTLLYNLQANIANNDLQNLQFFAAFAERAKEHGLLENTPFEHLIFLVRDWASPDEKPYGFSGGQMLLEQNLNLNDTNVGEEVRKLRLDIRRRLFRTVRAFLMPFPGNKVFKGQLHDGNLEDIDSDFLGEIQTFVETLLSPQNLQPKWFNGKEMNGRELFQYFNAYFNLSHSGNLSRPESPVEVMINMTQQNAVDQALSIFVQMMNQGFAHGFSLSWNEFNALNGTAANSSIEYFRNRQKMGGPDVSALFLRKLQGKIESELFHFRNTNTIRLERERLQRLREAQERANRLERERLQQLREAQERAQQQWECQKRRSGFGTLVGAVAGFMMGGPPGAIAGAAVGGGGGYYSC